METKTTKDNEAGMKFYRVYRPLDQTDGVKKPWPRMGVGIPISGGAINFLINWPDGTQMKLQARPVRKEGRA